MSVQYERLRGGFLTGDVVWVDEPDDIAGEGPIVQQQKRHAAEIIKRMDSSRKWHRLNTDDSLDGPRFVVGPDGASDGDGTPLADAINEAMAQGAVSAEVRTDAATGDTTVLPRFVTPDASMVKVGGKPVQPTQADVRKWAVEQGIDVNPMGQVPKKLIQQYLEAHGG